MLPGTTTSRPADGLSEALAAWYEEMEAGRAPDREQFARRYPDLADELASFFAAKDDFERRAGPLLPEPAATLCLPPQLGAPAELLEHPRYRVRRLLGRGGMGAVYEAEHALMERPVALKVLRPGLLPDPDAVARFRQEVRAAARLQHPNIVAALDADQAGAVTFLVMEYVEGQSLAERVAARGPLPAEDACEYVRQGALGLQHAHERGMVHRDVKPQNLMLTPQGQVKLLDFGLARLVSEQAPAGSADSTVRRVEEGAPGLTGPGMVMGTLDYVAPEQARDARRAGACADVYGLGGTLYFLLAGRAPFAAASPAEKLARLLTAEPASLEQARPDLPRGLAAVVGRMMAKRPQDRYQTAQEVAAALAPYAAPAGRRGRSRRGAGALALAVMLAGLLGGLGAIKVPTEHGEVVIETDDPDIEVVVKGPRIVRIVDPKTRRAYVLDRQDLTLALTDGPDGLQVTLDGERPVILKRQGKRIAAVRLERKGAKVGKKDRSPPAPVVEGERLPLRWEGARLTGLDLSPDGRRLAVGTAANLTRVYDTATGAARFDLVGCLVAFTPDGKQLVTATDYGPSEGGSVRVHDSATGKLIRETADPTGGVRRLLMSADGKTACTWSGTNVVLTLWGLQRGKALKAWPTTGGAAVPAWYHPDGRRLLVADREGWAWDLHANRPTSGLGTIRGLGDGYIFLPGGQEVIGTMSSWAVHDVATGRITRRVLGARSGRVAWKHGCWRLVVGHDAVPAYDPAATGAYGFGLRWGGDAPPPPAPPPPGARPAAAPPPPRTTPGPKTPPQPAFLAAIDLRTGRVERRLEVAFNPAQVAISGDGRVAAAGSARGEMVVWRLPELPPAPPAPGGDAAKGGIGEVRRFAGHAEAVHCVAVSPEGRWAASGGGGKVDGRGGLLDRGRDHLVRLWDVASGRELRRFDGASAPVTDLAFSNDGRLLAAAAGRDVLWWEIDTGRKLGQVRAGKGEKDRVRIALSSSGKVLVSAATDGTVRVWDVGSRREVRRLSDGPGPWLAVAFAPGHDQVTAAGPRRVETWALGDAPGLPALTAGASSGGAARPEPPASRQHTWRAPCSHVALANAHNGAHFFCSGGEEGGKVVRLLNGGDFKAAYTYEGHGAAVTAVASDELVATASLDGTVRVWGIQGGERFCYEGHRGPVLGVALTHDRNFVLSAGADGTVRLWRLPGATVAAPARATVGGDDLALVPGHSQGFASVRLAEALKVDFVSKGLRWYEARTGARVATLDRLRKTLGLALEDVERLTFVLHDGREMSAWAIVATARPYDRKAVLKARPFGTEEVVCAGRTFHLEKGGGGAGNAVHFFNDRVVVFAPEPGMRDCLTILSSPRRAGPLDGALKLARAKRHLVVGINQSALDVPWLRAWGMERGIQAPVFDFGSATLSLHLTDVARLEITAHHPGADRAKDWLAAVSAGKALLLDGLSQTEAWPLLSPAQAKACVGALKRALSSARMKAEGARVSVACEVDLKGPAAALSVRPGREP